MTASLSRLIQQFIHIYASRISIIRIFHSNPRGKCLHIGRNILSPVHTGSIFISIRFCSQGGGEGGEGREGEVADVSFVRF